MKLYLLSQSVNNDYDTFDSCVVAAENEDEARLINPDGENWDARWSGWAMTPSEVEVKYLGKAAKDIKAGIILASFNAG